MQTHPKTQLIELFQHLPPKIKTVVRFQNLNIREIDVDGQLERIYMAFGVGISSEARKTKDPFTIVVTASHNPPNYNGIKIQALGPLPDISVKHLQEIINSQQKFTAFLENLQLVQSAKKIDFFVGRDTRPNSKRLSQILIDTLRLLGNKVIDLGEGTTPEVISLSQFLAQNNAQNDYQNLRALQILYFKQIKESFQSAVSIISQQTGQKWQKKKIYMDFANGVGAISFKRYQFLNQYFDIIKVKDSDFSQPNVQCGAKWIGDHRLKLPSFADYPEADFYVWFDGDSDRIIMKAKQQNQLIQGEDFNICFTLWLKSLLQALNLQLKLGSVGNVNTNFGLVKYLQSLNIENLQVPVGICNLYKAAQRFDICCFFESNGHGCIYFSQSAIKMLEDLKQKHWQAQLLLFIHGLSRNNTRGYALHNFLLLLLYFHHHQTSNAMLFVKTYSLQKNFRLTNPQLFENYAQGAKLMMKPVQLAEKVKQISKQYNQLLIKVRKSQTEAKLRVTIQGSQDACKECLLILQQSIKNYL